MPHLSTLFHKYTYVFRGNRSLTVAALNGAARVSKRYLHTLANLQEAWGKKTIYKDSRRYPDKNPRPAPRRLTAARTRANQSMCNVC